MPQRFNLAPLTSSAIYQCTNIPIHQYRSTLDPKSPIKNPIPRLPSPVPGRPRSIVHRPRSIPTFQPANVPTFKRLHVQTFRRANVQTPPRSNASSFHSSNPPLSICSSQKLIQKTNRNNSSTPHISVIPRNTPHIYGSTPRGGQN